MNTERLLRWDLTAEDRSEVFAEERGVFLSATSARTSAPSAVKVSFDYS